MIAQRGENAAVRGLTTRFREKGFTLTELLVVLFILAMLLAVIVPSYGRAIAVVLRIRCASNLRHISEAYHTCISEKELITPVVVTDDDTFYPQAWPNTLFPYLTRHQNILLCPAGNGYFRGLPDVRLRVWWLGLRDELTFMHYPYWLESDHNGCLGVTNMWKLNADVYAESYSGESARVNMPQYTDGTNPNEYWFIVEDIGDSDFCDFDLHVLEKETSVEIYGIQWANAHADHAIIGPDGKLLEKTYGQTHMVTDTYEIWLPETHFAINSQVSYFSPGIRKILMLDYKSIICYTAQDEIGLDDGYDNLVAPRHLGQINILYSDGSVETVDPKTVDPDESTENADKYWNPLVE